MRAATRPRAELRLRAFAVVDRGALERVAPRRAGVEVREVAGPAGRERGGERTAFSRVWIQMSKTRDVGYS